MVSTWRKSEMATLLSKTKYVESKFLQFTWHHLCFSRTCLCFRGQLLSWKDEILFPVSLFSIHIFGMQCSKGVHCQEIFPSILWLLAVTRCCQIEQGRSVFGSALPYSEQRHELWLLYAYADALVTLHLCWQLPCMCMSWPWGCRASLSLTD